jgi:pimeloyl-ACP methyl ester carboxylesterase
VTRRLLVTLLVAVAGATTMLTAVQPATATIVTGAAASAAATPQCPRKDDGTSTTATAIVRSRRPVVLVHGWTGQPMFATAAKLGKLMPKNWQFLSFDYSAVNDHWAARQEIAPCLARYLHTVSEAYKTAGGDGRVYVVTHSMGGLATSYAVNPRYGGIADLGSRIAGVVTLDTPWSGSPWGATAEAWMKQTVSDLMALRLPDANSDASSCLRKVGPQGGGGCSTPAYLPRTVPVTQVAGHITISRSYFGVHAYDFPLGSDAVVTDTSQQGYLGSAPGSPLGLHTSLQSVSCTEDLDSILALAGATLGAKSRSPIGVIVGALVGSELQLLLDGKAMELIGNDQADLRMAELLARTIFASQCSHVNMPTYDKALKQVAAALQAQDAGTALTVTDLLNAPIPAYCQHRAGRLVNGKLPLSQSGEGSMGYATVLNGNGKPFLVRPVLTDLTRDGVPELVGVLTCSAGGVNWPDLMLAYRATPQGPALLGSLSLGDVTRREHAGVQTMTAGGGGVKLTWASYNGCCFFRQTWTGTMRWMGSKLQVEGLKQTSGPVGEELGENSVLTPDGLGPVQLGATTAETQAAVEPLFDLAPAGAGYCDSFSISGVSILLPGPAPRRVALITVSGGAVLPGIHTDRGIRVGSTVAQVHAAYPEATYVAATAVMPAHYRVTSGSHTLVFTIGAGKVQSMTAGTTAALAADEVCA